MRRVNNRTVGTRFILTHDQRTLGEMFRDQTSSGELDQHGLSPMGAIARSLDAQQVRDGLKNNLDPNQKSIGYFAGRAGITTKTPLDFAMNGAYYHTKTEPSSNDPITPGHHYDAALALVEGGARPSEENIQNAVNVILDDGDSQNQGFRKNAETLTQLIVTALDKGTLHPKSPALRELLHEQDCPQIIRDKLTHINAASPDIGAPA